MRNDDQLDKRLYIQKPMTATEVRIILFASLVLAAMGFIGALRIRQMSSSIYDLHIFFHQFLVHDLSGSLLCGLLLILAMVQFRRSLLPARVLDFLDRRRWIVAAVLTGLLAIGTLTIYHNYPLSILRSFWIDYCHSQKVSLHSPDRPAK